MVGVLTAKVLLKRQVKVRQNSGESQNSLATNNRHLEPSEPGDDPNFSIATQNALQVRVGLEVTIVQGMVCGFSACSSADFHLQHVFQAFHYLYQRSANVGLLEQEDVICAVVKLFHTVSGSFEDSWVISLYCFGKSWLHT